MIWQKKRFSSEELYSLRNDIPIEWVIKEALNITWQTTHGCFRFLCPLCNEFNTAVSPTTNLARCFCCEKNFNAIDLVMLINQCDFVNSIAFLKNYQQGNPIHPSRPNVKPTTPGPTHIGDVLQSIVSSSKPSGASSNQNLSNRVRALEHKLDRLARRIEEIAKSSL